MLRRTITYKDLTRTAGKTITNDAVDDVLQTMKKLAVREENAMVARDTLHCMHQNEEEPVRSFGARLQGQAGVCKFTLKCPHCDRDVNYAEPVVRDVLSKGLHDADIQLDLLGDNNQDMTLEEVIHFVEAKESVKRSASRLMDSKSHTHGADAASSSYRRDRKDRIKHDPPMRQDKSETCSYCGKKGHGSRAPARIRKRECAAYGKTCQHCNIAHHFESMCRGKNKAKPGKPSFPDESEGAVFDSLCSLT